jgi:hypothetical protein
MICNYLTINGDDAEQRPIGLLAVNLPTNVAKDYLSTPFLLALPFGSLYFQGI